ncbi:hypothetical protein P7K49_024488 [Saguinus oedipus]|uniref:Uncharacterized protein n=1 Tax=Saguinus oedipus TaxID=9490 RepID=A0ABQ9URY8_SAGOE|nr:hypothetical protein P7K49_024488 [Saguinus oedipus]
MGLKPLREDQDETNSDSSHSSNSRAQWPSEHFGGNALFPGEPCEADICSGGDKLAGEAIVTSPAPGRPGASAGAVHLQAKGLFVSPCGPEAENLTSCRLPRHAARPHTKPFLLEPEALEQLLTELDDFLKILDQENLSSTALVKKSCLAELLRLYTKSSTFTSLLSAAMSAGQQHIKEVQHGNADGKSTLQSGKVRGGMKDSSVESSVKHTPQTT